MRALSRFLFLLVLVGILCFPACEKETLTFNVEEEKVETKKVDLLATIKTNPNLTTLYSAIVYAEMEGILKARKEYTFFAPTDNAFDAYFRDQNWSSISDASKSQIKAILTFHISEEGMVKSAAFKDNQKFRILYGDYDIRLNLNDPEKPTAVLHQTNGRITDKELEATNGLIHPINRVLSL